MKKYTIALVEDDDEAGFYTKEFLQDCGFEVDIFILATDAISHIKFKHYDMLLLDLNLPDFDGFKVLEQIKSSIIIPTIVISAYSDIDTKLKAFQLGVLDYIVKPYNLKELEARILASLAKGSICSISNTFYLQENDVFFKNKKLSLTKTEYEILTILLENKDSTVSREDLANSLSKISSERSLDYHIKNIRIKLDDNGSSPKYLKTEYGVGYILNF